MNPFKAYDIRGIYPQQVNEDLAYDVGRAFPMLLEMKTVVVGRDGRLSSDSLFDSLLKGLLESGTNVVDLGQCSTPQFYYALYSSDIDTGVMITASHNPKEYNGFKICKANAVPLFKENGLPKLQSLIEHGQFKVGARKGSYIKKDIQHDYNDFFLKKKGEKKTFSFNILVDTGNGMGTYEMTALKELFKDSHFDILFEKVDGHFPNHECNPVIEKHYEVLKKKLHEGKYDFGMAFDGDADRITFFTEQGLVPPDLITGIIGSNLAKEGEKVGYEVRTSQAIPQLLEKKKIVPCLYPSGHAYIKQHMVQDGAVFAGEKSGHYFYQQLHNTDSSLFTVMQMLHILSSKAKTLSELVKPLQESFVNSGEINYTVTSPDTVLEKVKQEFSNLDVKIIDGVSAYGDGFFFNIRKSNTEPLVRVNIEAKTKEKVKKIKEKIEKIIARN
ncbi:MAG: phosphomannomutase/phosphoglucomutase [Nanoarchaeota archaeon]|nr:phosphomannomutase/phosphoglucomutase [Nanoarchaeota archaeon]